MATQRGTRRRKPPRGGTRKSDSTLPPVDAASPEGRALYTPSESGARRKTLSVERKREGHGKQHGNPQSSPATSPVLQRRPPSQRLRNNYRHALCHSRAHLPHLLHQRRPKEVPVVQTDRSGRPDMIMRRVPSALIPLEQDAASAPVAAPELADWRCSGPTPAGTATSSTTEVPSTKMAKLWASRRDGK